MIYVDSGIFIYPVIYDPKMIRKAALAEAKLLEIAEGELEASTCALTWDEVTWVTRRLFGHERAAAQGASLLKLPNLRILAVDPKTISKAQEILEEHELKPRDSIHAAAALNNRITKILTDDPDFDAVPELMRMPL